MPGTLDPIDSMAPWDAAPYFQQVTEVGVALAAGTPKSLCKADPNRVALILSSSALGSATVTLNPNGTTTIGMTVGGTIPPIILIYSEVGPLVQQEWFGVASNITTITVYEVRLAKWPKLNGINGGNGRANATRATKRNGNGR